MDKTTFSQILQVALFSFEGSKKWEIKKANPHYSNKVIATGCSLCSYLNSLGGDSSEENN